MTERDLATKQRADRELRLMIDHLEGHNVAAPRVFRRNLPAFGLRNFVLLKKHFIPGTRNYLLVIPAEVCEEILEACHDEPCSGHFGTAPTMRKIKAKYYWHRPASHITYYVRTCRDCQRLKTPPTRPAGLLQPISVP